MAAKAGNTVYWFRKALRLHDNPSLVSAIKASKTFHPVFCVDPKFGQSDKVGANRMSFLLETLEELDASLRAMDSRLIVLHGDPCVELPKVWDEWGVSHLCFEKDTEPYSIQRDAAITDLATKKGITVHSEVGHTILDPWETVAAAKGKPIITYQPFVNNWKALLKMKPLVIAETVERVPPLSDAARKQVSGGKMDVPSLVSLGYKASEKTTPFK